MAFIKVGIGISQKNNLIVAAEEAAKEAKKEIEGNKPKLLMFFCTYNYSEKDYEKGMKMVYDVFGDNDIPLVGGTLLGFFAKNKYYFDVGMLQSIISSFLKKAGKVIPPLRFNGVTVVALESDYINVGIGLGVNALENPQEAGKESINQALDDLEYNPSIAYLAMMKKGARDITRFRPLSGFLLTPGFSKEGTLKDEEIINGIDSVVKSTVRFIGGGLSQEINPDYSIYPKSGQSFFKGKVYKESVISILFGSDLEIGYGVASGLEPLPHKAVVTRSEGNIIYELNNRPAADVIREIYNNYTEGKEEDLLKIHARLGQEGYIFAYSDGKYNFYWPFMFSEIIKEKYVKSIIPIKEGTGITFGKIILDKIAHDTIEDSVRMIKEDACSEDFGFILFFSCAGRGYILKSDYRKEITEIKKRLNQKDTQIFGICSSGEQSFYKSGPVRSCSVILTLMGISNRLISQIKE
jgi:hypothetical protein